MQDIEFTLLIDANKGERQYWKDLWRYRELLYILAWKDVLVRYKQTVIGIAWSVLRPVLTMLAFVLVFNKVAKIDSGETPYSILVFSALLPWQFFSTALTELSNSLVSNSNLISKVYFPRLIIPTSSLIVCLIDFVISFVILIFLMIFNSYAPSWHIFFLPVLLLAVSAIALGAGLWLAALNVKYRDFRFVVPFIIQFGLYVSPVGFTSEIVPANFRFLYSLNPMVGIIDGFRWCILRENIDLYLPGVLGSLILTVLLLVGGIRYFRSTEKTFADSI